MFLRNLSVILFSMLVACHAGGTDPAELKAFENRVLAINPAPSEGSDPDADRFSGIIYNLFVELRNNPASSHFMQEEKEITKSTQELLIKIRADHENALNGVDSFYNMILQHEVRTARDKENLDRARDTLHVFIDKIYASMPIDFVPGPTMTLEQEAMKLLQEQPAVDYLFLTIIRKTQSDPEFLQHLLVPNSQLIIRNKIIELINASPDLENLEKTRQHQVVKERISTFYNAASLTIAYEMAKEGKVINPETLRSIETIIQHMVDSIYIS